MTNTAKKILKQTGSKRRLLIWGDPPVKEAQGKEAQTIFATGHGKIIKNLLPYLQKDFSTLQIGCGITGQYVMDGFKHYIVNFDGNKDYWGIDTFNRIIRNADDKNRPEVIMTVTDFKSQGVIYSDQFAEAIKTAGIPWVIWIAMDDGELRSEYLKAFLLADKIVGMAEYAQILITDHEKLPILKDKCSYFYPPVDDECFFYQPKEYRDALREGLGWTKKKMVLCIAKNQERKNIMHLLYALRRLPANYELCLVSMAVLTDIHTRQLDGWNIEYILNKWFPDLKSRVHVNNGQYIMTDAIPDKIIGNYFRAADCFVLPSRSEGLGFPFLEAMACGCPSIGSFWGPVSELLSEKRGLLIDNSDDYPYHFSMGQFSQVTANPSVKDMALKIMYACEDEELRSDIIRNGLEFMKMVQDKDRIQIISDTLMDAITNRGFRARSISPDIIF